MYSKDVLVAFAGVLTGLAEHPAPSGLIYAALMKEGWSYERYMALLDVLKEQQLVTVTSNVVALTLFGRMVAAKFNELMERSGGAPC